MVLIMLMIGGHAFAQKPIDPCYNSIHEKGYYLYSEYIFNMCNCGDPFLASDLMQWNGSEWIGRVSYSQVDLPPPMSACDSVRAIWMGYRDWTAGGEGFALKLDKPLETGKSYTFTFTYASDGTGSNGAFAPQLLTTNGKYPYLRDSRAVGYFPPAGYEWKTDHLTFRADEYQQGHDWMILFTAESSGIILSNCMVENPVKALADSIQNGVCEGELITLDATAGWNYKYQWNTGDTTSSINVGESGQYSVMIRNGYCESEQQNIDVAFIDCEPHLKMPNVFTPNGDDKNSSFKPILCDNIASSQLTIYNRWGQQVIATNLIDGWNGTVGSDEASPGVYYYELVYWDYRGWEYSGNGVVEVIR